MKVVRVLSVDASTVWPSSLFDRKGRFQVEYTRSHDVENVNNPQKSKRRYNRVACASGVTLWSIPQSPVSASTPPP